MMDLTMLASDTTAAFAGLVVMIIIIAGTGISLVCGSAAVAANWKGGRRRWWSLFLALSPLLFGVPALLLSIAIRHEPTIAGFPNGVLIPVAAVPLLSVPIAVYLWTRGAVCQPDEAGAAGR
jgi:hypothetical protein